MSLDTPSGESNASLSVRDAAALFGAPEPEQKPEAQATETAAVETPESPADIEAEADPEQVEEATPEAERVTVEVDGKTVELTKEQIAEAYKSGLRQADYTKKTMETAEQRKAADAEISKAREERQKYAEGLNKTAALLEASLQEQGQIDWQQLLETDPVEYLKQQHLANARQAKLQGIQQEQQQLHARNQAEQAEQMRAFLQSQQDELLAKLPEWKDEAKAKAGQAELIDWLKGNEYPPELLQIVDRSSHLIVGLRKGMLYDKMMSKAQAAAKKVQNLPQKVERPGGGETSPTDGRTAAMKRLGQSGSVRDAAAVFSQMFK